MRGQLLDSELTACFAPGVMTFQRFAESIVAHSPEPLRQLTPFMKRQLIGRLLSEANDAGRLKYFRPIADRVGLVDLCSQWISELKRLEIWPEHFEEACRRRGLEDKDRELHELYKTYQDCLKKHQLYDVEGRFWLRAINLEKVNGSPSKR